MGYDYRACTMQLTKVPRVVREGLPLEVRPARVVTLLQQRRDAGGVALQDVVLHEMAPALHARDGRVEAGAFVVDISHERLRLPAAKGLHLLQGGVLPLRHVRACV